MSDSKPLPPLTLSGRKRRTSKTAELEKRVRDLENRIVKIEQALWAVAWPNNLAPKSPANPWRDNTNTLTCSQCGMNWAGVMGYVCSMATCPMQSRVTCEVDTKTDKIVTVKLPVGTTTTPWIATCGGANGQSAALPDKTQTLLTETSRIT